MDNMSRLDKLQVSLNNILYDFLYVNNNEVVK